MDKIMTMYFPRLDSIRCYAVFAVVLSHSLMSWTWSESTKLLIPFGYLGVVVFFVLGGFLITRLLLRELPDKSLTQSFLHFYARRSLRIFPIYYLYLAIVFYWNIYDIAATGFYPWMFLTNFYIFEHGWIGANSHIWTLAIQEQFYIVVPILILFWRKNTTALLALFGVIITTALVTRLYLVIQYPIRPGLWVFTLACLDYLAIGGILAIAYEKIGERIKPYGVPLVLGAIAIYYGTYFLKTQFAFGDLLFWSLGRMAMAFGGAGLIIIGIYGGKKFSLIHNPFTMRMGVISYGIYLYHNVLIAYYADIAGAVGIELGDGLALKIIASLVIMIALAEISHRWIESPLLRLKNRFR